MGRRLPVSRKEDIVLMSATHSNTEIARALGTTPRSCQRVLKLWREERLVERPSRLGGRPRALNSFDLEVSRYCYDAIRSYVVFLQYLEARLERDPSMYLSELRAALLLGRGVDVCEKTIANSLRRRGWTYKKVYLSYT